MNRFFSALVVCMLSVSAFAHAEESASPEQGMGAASARNENHRLASIRLIENYLVPAYEALAAQTNAQATAWEGACSTPTAEQLAQLQQHYVKTANLWAKVEFIRFGPVSFLLRHERVNHWPERRNAVGRALTSLIAKPDADVLAPGQFSRASVAVQGLPALERLLFTQSEKWQSPADGDGAAVAWRCAIGKTIAANLATISTEIVQGWQEAEGPLAQAKAGNPHVLYFTDASDLGRRLLTDQMTGFQIMGDIKLEAPLGSASEEGTAPVVKATKLEAWRSGQSKANLLANLQAMKEMTYAWGTTSKWTDAQQTEIAKAFEDTRTAFNALPDDMKSALEEGTAQAPIQQALTDLRSLRNQVASVLPDSLDLTLGFNALDGD
ncbi:MAG: putative lipoprotein [Parvibaculaceae bacterium]|jgi:predicted lipoprotein|nr:imelysin family protein [Parvibaculaceae bacterium]|tara:strand:+ start:741 stop:1883 length:1143 start_codon:yes stop_codon:yes gene_type:complete